MKTSELRDKSIKDLQQVLEDRRSRLSKLKFEISQGKVKNLKEARESKKEIAMIMTLINQKSKMTLRGVASGSKDKK